MIPDFSKDGGLAPVIVQDSGDGRVLMLGYMNQQAYEQTLATGYVTFFSRSRQKLWMKGETSGNRLRLRQIALDCDADAILVQAEQEGRPAVCHEGYRSCFFRTWDGKAWVIGEPRVFSPEAVYGQS